MWPALKAFKSLVRSWPGKSLEKLATLSCCCSLPPNSSCKNCSSLTNLAAASVLLVKQMPWVNWCCFKMCRSMSGLREAEVTIMCSVSVGGKVNSDVDAVEVAASLMEM